LEQSGEITLLVELGIAMGRVEARIADNPDLTPFHKDPRWRRIVQDVRHRVTTSTTGTEGPNG